MNFFGGNSVMYTLKDVKSLGTQKIYIRTWGCSHNNSDGEYMAGQLAAYGYKITGTVIILSPATTVHGYVHV